MKGFFFALILLSLLLFTGCGIFSNSGKTGTDDVGQTGGGALAEYPDANTALAEGTRFLDTGEIENAIDALNQAVTLDPDLAEAFFKLGIAYRLVEMRDTLSGEMQVEDVAGTEGSDGKKKPNSMIAFEKAVEAYKKIVAANPDDHVAQFNLGRAYGKLDRDNEAERSLRQAVKLNPDDTEYQTEFGSILIRLAKYQEAVGVLKKALEIDPSNSQAEELLERADAGRKRLDYVTVKKEDKKDGEDGETANGDENPTGNANTAFPSNSAPPKTPLTQSRPKATPLQ